MDKQEQQATSTRSSTDCYHFSGDRSKPFWDAVNAAEPDAGILYKMGCYGQRLETAMTAARIFIDSHVADPDITEDMAQKFLRYQQALRNL